MRGNKGASSTGKKLRSFLPLVPLLMLLGGSSTAHAASLYSLKTDVAMVSVGDQINVTFQMNLGLGLPGTFEYSYRIPDTARYIPNTFEWNGSPIPDSDSRLTVTSTEVKLTLPGAPGELTLFELRLRATGSIGDAVHHHARAVRPLPLRDL